VRRKNRRIIGLAVGGVLLACATALTLYGLRDSLVFFMTPTEIVEQNPQRSVRVGGMVEENSVQYGDDAIVTFRVTDYKMTIPVYYQGVLPDLFREGQGVVAQGEFRNNIFVASEILAKHDEDYMPREIKDMMEHKGQTENAE
jgi:cytochrome c-type biogenesis protein CcmE